MTTRRALVFGATTLGVLGVDQATKALVRASMDIGDSRPLIDGILRLTHVHNKGAAFGMFQGQQWLLIAIAVLVIAAIAYVALHLRIESPVARAALSLVAAGAIGNLIDRAVLGGVTDFFDLGWWPVFNVADMSLDIGVALLVWWVLFSPEHVEKMAAEPTIEEAPEGGAEVE